MCVSPTGSTGNGFVPLRTSLRSWPARGRVGVTCTWRRPIDQTTGRGSGSPRPASLTVLLIGRLTGVGSAAHELGRREAITGGWYWSARRRLQGAVILGVGTLALLSVVMLTRLTGSRTRRYLAPLVCVLGLAGFAAATRIVSLHQVDAMLYRRPIFGARIASLIELILTAVLVVLAVRANPSSDPVVPVADQNRLSI